jgi:hypothetical protein
MSVCVMTMRMRVGVLSLMMPFGFVCLSVANSSHRFVVPLSPEFVTARFSVTADNNRLCHTFLVNRSGKGESMMLKSVIDSPWFPLIRSLLDNFCVFQFASTLPMIPQSSPFAN